MRQGRTRNGEGEEGNEGVRQSEGVEGVKGVTRARSMEVTPSTATMSRSVNLRIGFSHVSWEVCEQQERRKPDSPHA